MIITNLTGNQGCSGAGYGKLCREFLTCMKTHHVCIVSGKRVVGGGTAADFSGKDRSISFAAISRVSRNAPANFVSLRLWAQRQVKKGARGHILFKTGAAPRLRIGSGGQRIGLKAPPHS